MIIQDKKYVIVSKEFPLEFYDGSGGFEKSIDCAFLYDSKNFTERTLKDDFDEPDKFQIIDVMVTYEF